MGKREWIALFSMNSEDAALIEAISGATKDRLPVLDVKLRGVSVTAQVNAADASTPLLARVFSPPQEDFHLLQDVSVTFPVGQLTLVGAELVWVAGRGA